MRCKGWRRHGGAFTLGPVQWVQCDQEAAVKITVKQDGEVKTFPACQKCWEEVIERGLKIEAVKPLKRKKAAGGK